MITQRSSLLITMDMESLISLHTILKQRTGLLIISICFLIKTIIQNLIYMMVMSSQLFMIIKTQG